MHRKTTGGMKPLRGKERGWKAFPISILMGALTYGVILFVIIGGIINLLHHPLLSYPLPLLMFLNIKRDRTFDDKLFFPSTHKYRLFPSVFRRPQKNFKID